MNRAGLVVMSVVGAFFSVAAFAQAPQPPAALPGPLPLFPADNWWNQDVSTAPVDANSAGFLSLIGNPSLHPDFGGSDGSPNGTYGMTYAVVPGTTALEPVDFEEYGYADESDAGAPGRPPGYPIPLGARTEPRWIEGGEPATCHPQTQCPADRHLLIVDGDRRLLFELYQAHWDGSRWYAGSGAVWRLDSNDRRPEGWTSADAAGLAILPGLVRYDEVFGTDPIRHAFRVTVRYTKGHVWPASHTASTSNNANALPMGARLRLKASTSLGGLSAPLQKIGQALKTYGLIVADNGSNMYVTGTYDPRWESAPSGVIGPSWPFRASDFEVIQLGWRPATPPNPTATRFQPVLPCRLLDTRLGAPADPSRPLGGPALDPGAQRIIVATGRCGIPGEARALALDISVIQPGATGHIRVYPGDQSEPLASALNFAPGRSRANNAFAALASSGSGTLALRNRSSLPVHVVLDVNGYFE